MRVRWLLVVSLAGCEGWLDIPPPGQVFETIKFTDASAGLGAERLGPTYGIGWGDVNGDGWPDLWSGNHATASSLYVNDGKGGFVEQSDNWFEPDFQRIYDAHGIAFVDLDNDGRSDMVESVGAQRGEGQGKNRVHWNSGPILQNRAAELGLERGQASGRCPVPHDWNRDGRVDMLLVSQPDLDDPNGTFPTARLTQGEDGVFTLSSEQTDNETAIPTALCGMLADVDGDRKTEVVAFGRPEHLQVFPGDGPSVSDIGPSLGMPVAPNHIFDVAFGDVDNDLDDDIYVARTIEASEALVKEDDGWLAMILRVKGLAQGARFATDGDVHVSLDPAGFWTAEQWRLGAGCEPVPVDSLDMEYTFSANDPKAQGLCDRMRPGDGVNPGDDPGFMIGYVDGKWEIRLWTEPWNRGNIVVQSAAPLRDVEFVDVAFAAEETKTNANRDRLYIRGDGTYDDDGWNRGITEAEDCTSVAMADFDNDMDLDLFLTCATGIENTPDALYLNNGAGIFTRILGFGAEGTTRGHGDSVALADYDRDGFIDIFVSNGYAALPFNQGPHQLFHNEGNANHWLELQLEGTRSTRDAWGAVVIVRAGGVEQLREVSGTHHMAQNDRTVHVGLGRYESADEVEIHWPSGDVQTVYDIASDQLLHVREGEDPL